MNHVLYTVYSFLSVSVERFHSWVARRRQNSVGKQQEFHRSLRKSSETFRQTTAARLGATQARWITLDMFLTKGRKLIVSKWSERILRFSSLCHQNSEFLFIQAAYFMALFPIFLMKGRKLIVSKCHVRILTDVLTVSSKQSPPFYTRFTVDCSFSDSKRSCTL